MFFTALSSNFITMMKKISLAVLKFVLGLNSYRKITQRHKRTTSLHDVSQYTESHAAKRLHDARAYMRQCQPFFR